MIVGAERTALLLEPVLRSACEKAPPRFVRAPIECFIHHIKLVLDWLWNLLFTFVLLFVVFFSKFKAVIGHFDLWARGTLDAFDIIRKTSDASPLEGFVRDSPVEGLRILRTDLANIFSYAIGIARQSTGLGNLSFGSFCPCGDGEDVLNMANATVRADVQSRINQVEHWSCDAQQSRSGGNAAYDCFGAPFVSHLL